MSLKKLKTAWIIFRTRGPLRIIRLLWIRLILGAIYILGRSIHINTRRDITKRSLENFVDAVNQMQGPLILELGSRDISRKHLFKGYSEYVGFDIHPGRHVDVVGDVHLLSRHFPENHFDAVYSASVFEHLAMPWKAALEINRVLKPGGLLFTVTHPAYPPHCLPWDFWRFTRSGFATLLNAKTGFEIVEWSEGIPSIQLPIASMEPQYRDTHTAHCFIGITVLARKISEPDPSLSWNVDMSDIMSDLYPSGETTGAPVKIADFVDVAKGRGTLAGD